MWISSRSFIWKSLRSRRSENLHFLPLSWPWPDLWPCKENFMRDLEASRWHFSNVASPVSLRPSVLEIAGGRNVRSIDGVIPGTCNYGGFLPVACGVVRRSKNFWGFWKANNCLIRYRWSVGLHSPASFCRPPSVPTCLKRPSKWWCLDILGLKSQLNANISQVTCQRAAKTLDFPAMHSSKRIGTQILVYRTLNLA